MLQNRGFAWVLITPQLHHKHIQMGCETLTGSLGKVTNVLLSFPLFALLFQVCVRIGHQLQLDCGEMSQPAAPPFHSHHQAFYNQGRILFKNLKGIIWSFHEIMSQNKGPCLFFIVGFSKAWIFMYKLQCGGEPGSGIPEHATRCRVRSQNPAH